MKSHTPCNMVTDTYRITAARRRCLARQGFEQRGVVLFFTLIALLAMSLAAVALIRSVDTSALISGNLASKQMVITGAERGIADAMGQLANMRNASAVDLDLDASHPLNQTNLAAYHGYYSSFNSGLDVTGLLAWVIPNGSVNMGKDASGVSVSYIIQRMCRTPNVTKLNADCVVGPGSDDGNNVAVKNATQACPTCTPPGEPAVTRITVKATDSRNSTSFIQEFVY